MGSNYEKHCGHQEESPPPPEKKGSCTALPKGKLPRPQLLHLHPLRNSVSKEDESGNIQTTLKKKAKKPTTNTNI
jgi:hypothetical protein